MHSEEPHCLSGNEAQFITWPLPLHASVVNICSNAQNLLLKKINVWCHDDLLQKKFSLNHNRFTGWPICLRISLC